MHRVLKVMKQAYEILHRELRLADESQGLLPKSMDIYLGDTEDQGLIPFGGFELSDFRRAPLFVIRKDPKTQEKSPVILMPVDYQKFLKYWNQINEVPHDQSYREDEYLGSSIIHEMTHALIHSFNENLGSTEHEIRNGD